MTTPAATGNPAPASVTAHGSGPAATDRPKAAPRRVLVAGVGNVFLGDDGVGVEVAARLAGEPLPAGVTVADFGIRGVHLAYELLGGGYDALVLVDAVHRGDPPGTVTVIEHLGRDGAGDPAPSDGAGVLAAMDAHGMHPAAVLAMLHDLGGSVGRVLVVGVEAAGVGEGMGCSEPVLAAVPAAARAALEVAASLAEDERLTSPSGLRSHVKEELP